MKNLIIIFAVLSVFVLTGCDNFLPTIRYHGFESESMDCHSASVCFDHTSLLYRIHYRIDDVDPNQPNYDYGAAIDESLITMAGCLGVPAELPNRFVVVVTNDVDAPASGKTFTPDDIIVVKPKVNAFFSVMEHESVHALYFANYGNPDSSHIRTTCYPSGTILGS